MVPEEAKVEAGEVVQAQIQVQLGLVALEAVVEVQSEA
jgi:hypothetical protein